MKTLLSLLGGAITVTEQNGMFFLNWNESLGGGSAAGVLKGVGSLQLQGNQALQIGEEWLNGKLPAILQPLAKGIEGIVNKVVESKE